jgi:hypothetical protein
MSTPVLKWTRHQDLAINTRPSVGREEYLDHMTFRRNDRPLFTEIFGPLVGLKEEWEAQGATPAELDFSAFRYRGERRAYLPVSCGFRGGQPEVQLEETSAHRIWRDALGRTMKLPKGTATLPMPMDYPVRDMDDWLRIKPGYEFDEARLAGDWRGVWARARKEDAVIRVSIPGGFDEPRQLMGEEELCVAYYEQPELLHDMRATFTNTVFQVLERVTRECPVDVLFVHEDMAGKSGPLVGPAHIREFITPYYRRIWDLCQSRGARLFDQDSDGDMNPVIDVFLEAGVNCMHPMEPAANMDVVKMRERYGTRLAFYGGIDKYALMKGPEAVDAELAQKLPTLLASGGCVIALDHRIPGGVKLSTYHHYLQRIWQWIE